MSGACERCTVLLPDDHEGSICQECREYLVTRYGLAPIDPAASSGRLMEVVCRRCNEPLPKDYLYPVCEKCLKEGTTEESTLPPVETDPPVSQ